MLVAFNSIIAKKANSTEATAKAVTQLLNYADTNSEAITRYHVSSIILHIHSDASFQSETGSKRRVGRYIYLSTVSALTYKATLK